MATAMSTASDGDLPTWVEVIRPKEHGSWSLVLEPLALSLLVAPSWAGVALAVTVVAAFFARRPLRLLVTERNAGRRGVAARAAIACAIVAAGALLVSLLADGGSWLPWLIPTAIGGAAFLYFDLHRAGREQAAEIAGSCAFAVLPAVFARIAGLSAAVALALAAVMLARSLPTVLVVRATIRARKASKRPSAFPFFVTLLALGLTLALAGEGRVPRIAVIGTTVLAVRAYVLLIAPRPSLRASTIGITEAAIGAAYVFAIGMAW